MKTIPVSSVFGTLSLLILSANAQSNQNCPLLGAVYPPPSHPSSSKAVAAAQKEFPQIIEQALGSGLLDNETTSFSINVFSASDNQTLYTQHFAAPGLAGSLPSGSLNDDTIYRIGSMSKLFTAYALLAKRGFADFNEPVTKYIPELAAAPKGDPLTDYAWDEITVEALANHLAGVPRDYATTQIDYAALGLPKLNSSEAASCGLSATSFKECTRQQYIQGVLSEHPVNPSYQAPAYSNIGYVLLGYILEKVANQTYGDAIASSILTPLNLTRTFTQTPNDTNIIAPGNITAALFAPSGEFIMAAGGIYSTASDFRTLGLSILQNQLLRPLVTRKWMRLASDTPDPSQTVGAPWEIRRMELPLSPTTNSTRLVDLYSKSGDISVYSTLLVLDRDHNIGYSILTAGKTSGTQRSTLGSLISATWVPALEAAAIEEANATFAGTYASANKTENTLLTITVGDDRPGLGVSQFMYKGQDYRGLVAGTKAANTSMRLYPTALKTKNRASFRAVFEQLPKSKQITEGVFNDGCISWFTVAQNPYGSLPPDEFQFEFDGEGKVVSVTPMILKESLVKAAEAS